MDSPVAHDVAPGLTAEDLATLRCPLSGRPLHLEEGGRALVTDDAATVYPIVDGILCLTISSAQRRGGSVGAPRKLNPVTAGLQRFYDDVGWQGGDGRFEDAELFEDLRPVSTEYIGRCHRRVGEALPASGERLLDAGSGPVQFPEYLDYQHGFGRRVCVDISLTALRQARGRVGDRGLYIQADLTRLPFADATIDAAVSLHVIYHVEADLQEQAFRELYRVLKPQGRAVVVYQWAQTPAWRLIEGPNAIKLRWQRFVDHRRGGAGEDEESRRAGEGFYFHPYPLAWFASRPWPFQARLAVWRSATVPALRMYIHPWLGGRWLLRALFAAETRWPEWFGRHGSYPMIVIDRPGKGDPIAG